MEEFRGLSRLTSLSDGGTGADQLIQLRQSSTPVDGTALVIVHACARRLRNRATGPAPGQGRSKNPGGRVQVGRLKGSRAKGVLRGWGEGGRRPPQNFAGEGLGEGERGPTRVCLLQTLLGRKPRRTLVLEKLLYSRMLAARL